ncbi:hypothetical protein [Plantibacter sp. M259]|nr:hypothetical protein [Plantibacter sp. M259]
MAQDIDWILALADEIGRRMDAGQLPPQDENGMYVMDGAARDAAEAVSS